MPREEWNIAGPSHGRGPLLTPWIVGAGSALGTFIIAVISVQDPSPLTVTMIVVGSLILGAIAVVGTRLSMGRLPGQRERLEQELRDAMRFARRGDSVMAREKLESVATEAIEAGNYRLAIMSRSEAADLEYGLGHVTAAVQKLELAKRLVTEQFPEPALLLRVEADILRTQGQYRSAEQAYRRAEHIADRERDLETRASALLGRVHNDRVLGRFAEGQRRSEEAYESYAQLQGDPGRVGMGKVRLAQGELALAADQNRRAADLISKARRLFDDAHAVIGVLESDISASRRPIAEGGAEKALEGLRTFLGLAKNYDSRYLQARCYEAIADWETDRQKGEAAKAAYRSALDLYRRSGNRLREANMLASLAYLAREANDVKVAVALSEEASRAYMELDATRGLAGLTLDLAEHTRIGGDDRKARELYGQAKVYCAEANWRRGEIRVSIGRSELEAHTGQLDDARVMIVIAAAQAEQLADDDLLAQILVRLGQVELWLGKPEAARRHYRRAAKLERGGMSAKALAHVMLSDLERIVGRPMAAWEHLDSAGGLYLQGTSELMRANLSRIKGDLLRDSNRGQLEEAESELEKALSRYWQLYHGEGENEGLGESKLGLARIHIIRADLPAAKTLCTEAIEHFEKARFFAGLVDARVLLAEVLLGSSHESDHLQWSEAEQLLEQAWREASKAGYVLGEAKAHAVLGRAVQERESAIRHLHVAWHLFSQVGMNAESARCREEAMELLAATVPVKPRSHPRE